MPANGSSPQESEPLLPTHRAHNPLPISSSHASLSSSTPTRSRLSARRYIPSSGPSDLTPSRCTGKGKGKAKATEDDLDLEAGLAYELNEDEDEDQSQDQDQGADGLNKGKDTANKRNKGKDKEPRKGRNVTIIFSNESELTGSGNLQCWIEDYENVGNLKDQIKTLRPSLQDHSLRLIHSGRLLTDGILLLPWLRSLEERVRRQAAGVGGDVESVLKDVGLAEEYNHDDEDDLEEADSPKGRRRDTGKEKTKKGIKAKEKEKENEKVWLHCIVGGKEEKAQTSNNEGEEEPSAPRRRGFDVLLDAGLSADDVAAMRRQFYESRGEEVPEGMEGGDVNDEHARALEEQWIEGDMTAETATTTSEGLYTSILHGLLTGFLFPIIPWFFFREPPLPNFFDSDAEALAISTSLSQSQSQSQSQGSSSIPPSTTTHLNHSNADANLNPSDERADISDTPSSPQQHVSANNDTSTNTSTTVNANTNSAFVSVSAQERFIRAGGIGIGLGEIVASQVFGKRMQMGILLGTILNIAFGALRFLN
ncbi:uncharacterized protein I303_105366 [Kwoniella dejecticola CBS 10117]|uniref:Ubiquitin-like domain-containing protein n=1 Tax=Kwoniella dejecticola CBS 10117 TaxID=1296121 RepID=A0A1A6A2P5_9TREE|nr:uncharacterized protein I303_05188 [Kwoniella dejecticola CBS 10117]OBR84330.1 hypothetical protein I303_05188 [Kwoniella dejecticola CBS 10117]